MHIRRATIDDAAAIARVHVASWRTTYAGIMSDEVLAGLSELRREEMWSATLADENSPEHVFVATADTGEIVGFASCGPARDAETGFVGELYAIYLLQSHQHRGIGRRLFEAVVGDLRKRGMTSLYAHVLATNSATGFYEALGGRKVKDSPYRSRGQSLPAVVYGWETIAGRRADSCGD